MGSLVLSVMLNIHKANKVACYQVVI